MEPPLCSSSMTSIVITDLSPTALVYVYVKDTGRDWETAVRSMCNVEGGDRCVDRGSHCGRPLEY
jgi:hypothetical protein